MGPDCSIHPSQIKFHFSHRNLLWLMVPKGGFVFYFIYFWGKYNLCTQKICTHTYPHPKTEALKLRLCAFYDIYVFCFIIERIKKIKDYRRNFGKGSQVHVNGNRYFYRKSFKDILEMALQFFADLFNGNNDILWLY